MKYKYGYYGKTKLNTGRRSPRRVVSCFEKDSCLLLTASIDNIVGINSKMKRGVVKYGAKKFETKSRKKLGEKNMVPNSSHDFLKWRVTYDSLALTGYQRKKSI